MSYPDVIHARELRQGDRIYTGSGRKRLVLATFWKPGYSFIRVLVEGENHSRSLGIGEALYVERTPA
jgi:hypothetical protein